MLMSFQKVAKTGKTVSGSGGWCETESKENSGNHVTDKVLAAYFADFFGGMYQYIRHVMCYMFLFLVT